MLTTVEWKNRLPNILCGYNDDDLYNVDEIGLLFKAIPDNMLVVSMNQCIGGKRSKERDTLSSSAAAAQTHSNTS
jgi:hypothetical protein